MNIPIRAHPRIPFWRNARFWHIFGQVAFIFIIVLIANWFYTNLRFNMQRTGIEVNFNFLHQIASFDIGEGLAFEPTDSFAYAFLVGVVNTLRVIGIGLVLATFIGLMAGMARLSSNWLISRIAGVYVETLRNTPLVVQLFFWYTAVFLKLPKVDESIELPGPIYLNQRGLALPQPFPTESFSLWSYFLIAGLLIATGVYIGRRIYLKRIQRPGFPALWALSALLGIAGLGWAVLLAQPPIAWQVPVMGNFNFEGGFQLTPEYAALLLGLVAYTGAFISEIVRAGILSVSKGQKEAARALGLTHLQLLRLVVLPQALRVMVPPMTSQYLNLAKNSSLAVAIGYPDLFSVASTIINQSGRAIETILLLAASYLSMSLLTSLFMNWYNRRVKLVER